MAKLYPGTYTTVAAEVEKPVPWLNLGTAAFDRSANKRGCPWGYPNYPWSTRYWAVAPAYKPGCGEDKLERHRHVCMLY